MSTFLIELVVVGTQGVVFEGAVGGPFVKNGIVSVRFDRV
jgi:hypothetical protein